jgi:hypothetical protein
MSLNRFPFKTAALAAAIIATPLTEAAGRNYHEPTRGFFIEHGEVAAARMASVELQTGRDIGGEGSNLGGGIRLGLSKAELLINSGLGDYDQNELMVKWGMSKLSGQSTVNWALLGGVSHIDAENESREFEQTNLKAGVAFTIRADAGMFTIAPMLVYADGETRPANGNTDKDIDDTFLELGLGGYLGLADTEAGKFSVGLEAIITTQDYQYGEHNNDDADKDNTFALGLKWAYSERVHIDIVPFVRTNDEMLGIPGLVRLNMAF